MESVDNNITLIDFHAANISYNQLTVLHDVNFKVNKGEFVYLVGRVGSGKSSLLKSLYADAIITEGQARILEYDLTTIDDDEVPYLRRKLGIVFQDFKLLTDRNVHDNLEFVLRATDMKDKMQIESRIDEVLRTVNMSNKGYKMPFELSGGEQQRIVVARALLNNPCILLADEPTGNLDAHTGEDLMRLVYGVVQNGTSVIMATHNMRWINMFPGRVFHCEDGHMDEIPASRLSSFSLDDYYNL